MSRRAYSPSDDIPSLAVLYATSRLTPTTTSPSPLAIIPTPARTSRFNDRISLLRTDITRLPLTAIVNAANTSLLGGGGVDGAIHRAAGHGLYDECATLQGCETGDAKITAGHRLPAEFVIHAVGPVYGVERRRKKGREERLLSGCYTRALELVRDVGVGKVQGGGDERARRAGAGAGDGQQRRKVSIGFSGLSTGVYGYPKAKAARVAIASVVGWLADEANEGRELVDKVVFVCFEREDHDAYLEFLPQFCPPADEEQGGNGEEQTAATQAEEAGKTQEEELKLPDVPAGLPKRTDEPNFKKVKLSSGDDKAEL